jgi:ABC-type glycerol-3-phosphate transport system substrate-binding protein
LLDRLVRRSLSRRSFLAGLGAAAALPVIAACEPQIVEKVVEKPVEVVVTRVVQEVVEKEVVVEKAVEVEKEVTRVVQEVVEVEKETLVEVEKEVVVEVERVVTVEVEKEVFKEIVVAAAGAPYLPRTDSMPAGGIRFATWGNAMDEAVEAWNESFPDNLVKHEITPYGEHTNKILIEMAAGTAPDTILISGAFFHTVAAKGVLWGYNDAIKADKLDLEGWAVDQRHWSSWPRGGEIYGFHHHAPVIDTVYYNKEIMAEAGVGTTIDHFWNLSDYQELATALNGNAPDVWGSNGLGSTRTFHGFLAGLDGKFFVDEDESAVNMTSDECREALRIITAPYLEWGVAPDSEAAALLGESPFANGKFALFTGVGTAYVMVRVYGLVDEPFDWWWADPPTPDNGSKAHGGIPHHYTVNPGSKIRDAAWEWTKWISMDTEALKIMSKQIPPGYNPLGIFQFETDPDIKRYNIESLARTEYFVMEWWGAKAAPQMTQIFHSERGNVILGEKTIDEAAADMKDQMDKALAEAD